MLRLLECWKKRNTVAFSNGYSDSPEYKPHTLAISCSLCWMRRCLLAPHSFHEGRRFAAHIFTIFLSRVLKDTPLGTLQAPQLLLPRNRGNPARQKPWG